MAGKNKKAKNKENHQELPEGEEMRLTGGQLIDGDIDSPNEEENKPVAKTDARSGSEKSGNVKKPFILQCNAKDNISLRSSQKGNKLFENDNPIQPLLKNDQMEFNPAINSDTDQNRGSDAIPDPETFWEQLTVVTKLAVGPIISMIF